MRIFLGDLEKLLTPEMAREAAVRLKMNINEGEQPYSRKNENKLTLKQLYDDFMSEKEGILRPQTLYNYKSIWNNKLQKIGQKAVKNITSDELKVLHKHITAEHGSYIANQAVVLVRTLINYAIKEGKYKNFNPAIAVKLNKKEARARYNRVSISRLFGFIYNKFGIKRASHLGRHLFVSKLVNSGVNICLVQKLANHRNIATTQRYFNYNEKMLANAVENVRV